MIPILTTHAIEKFLSLHGTSCILRELTEYMRDVFSHWDEFQLTARSAFHTTDGVVEVMPCANHEYFAQKTVNGHPKNPNNNLLTIVAIGSLHDMHTGYPRLVSEMTYLTTLRTGAASVLASTYLARPDSSVLSIIGCGGQSEFQIIAHCAYFPIASIRYYDIDPRAMDKFAHNLGFLGTELVRCTSSRQAVDGADIVITVTADKKNAIILENDWISAGVHISALGGDCPGKTELQKSLVERADKVVVEYIPQSAVEGEIQVFGTRAHEYVHAELHEIIRGSRAGRESREEITIFDGVGFALEDWVVLRFFYDKIQDNMDIVHLDMVPEIDDPKNLFANLVKNHK